MFLEKFFYGRLMGSEFTWDDALYCGISLVALIWLSVWWNHKRNGRWGWGLSRYAALLWLVAVIFLIVFRLSEIPLFTGRFVSGLKLENDYITTATPTPDSRLSDPQVDGFRLTVFHFHKVMHDDGAGHKSPGKGMDYVRHIWVSPSEYLYLVGWLRTQNLPLPHAYDPSLFYAP